MPIAPSTLQFLRDLSQNNNRDWFQANKARYEAARANVADFADALIRRLGETDVLETESGKKSMFRIYRDVRFSKNKDPYKTSLSGRFVRDGKMRRGGYYYHFGLDEIVIGGGFYGIESKDLKRIRAEVAVDPDPLRAIVSDKDFVEAFGSMRGEQLKTAPQGYDRDHPSIDLLRYKQFYAFRNFSETEIMRADFIDAALLTMQRLRPFFDYFSEVLTTDANGQPID